ncbi:ferritin-like domain-containing protein [Methylomarinum sp. Ch1-1]|uniref:Ferritin-like domain-containing protein n=1 Tax=Methylomarinum roseum TaxID=3067653 RepID=A0AAU7NQ48_9GAMM|nr:ferritin-like domain-containing protein [Methylomarinum sp. Ch1-1]MDP4520964.1 ferritin-like domain-containing protein [Methylomarinum sp. Ch1-1]
MENIFTLAAQCLQRNEIDEKLALTHQAFQCANSNSLSFQSNDDVLPIGVTVFPSRPELLSPRDMPRRALTSDSGRAAFFHALAHIEFVAIYLAWDIVYRFRGLPEQFYRDWLRVADEEAQHFALLRKHLMAMGVDYGDLPAHRGLWDHAEDTAADLLARLALVPRCMEARGLDVTPAMIEKFKRMGDDDSVRILSRILEDEVGHVELGSYWFKYFCRTRGYEPEEKYRQLIVRYYKGKPKGPFNREMRIIAGFSNVEIDWLESRANE